MQVQISQLAQVDAMQAFESFGEYKDYMAIFGKGDAPEYWARYQECRQGYGTLLEFMMELTQDQRKEMLNYILYNWA